MKAGSNAIERDSNDFFFTIPDEEPGTYRRIEKALEGGEAFKYHARLSGFPNRLLLPKGKKEGLPLQFFIYVSPVTKTSTYASRVFGNYVFDNRPAGFPLDRPITKNSFVGPNFALKDVLVYHKIDNDMNVITGGGNTTL